MRVFNSGKSLTEYGLILALVAVVAVPALLLFGNTTNISMTEISTKNKEGSDELISLLSSERWDEEGTESTGSGEWSIDSPYGPTQPIEELAFDYDPDTGLVAIIDSGSGSSTTSGEGTTILVRNLQDLLEQYPNVMTPEQEGLLSQLINQGNNIAAEEERLLIENPGFEDGTATAMCFFDAPCGADSALVSEFKDFKTTYESLISSMASSDALVLQMQETIDINASLISQLVAQNFIDVQAQHETPTYLASTVEPLLTESTVKAKKVNIKNIKIEETAAATTEAATGL